MSILKKLASDTAVYGIGSLLGRLLNFLLFPFHTYIFETDGYGIVSIFYANAALLNVIYTYGMETAFFRFATDKKYNSDEVYKLSLTSIFITSFFLSGILIFSTSSLTHFLHFPNAKTYIFWFVGILAIDAILAIPFAKLRLEGKAKKFAFTKLVNIFLNIFLNIFFLYFCRKIAEGEFLNSLQNTVKLIYNPELGVGYVFLSNLIANILIFPILGKELLQFRPILNFKKLRPILVYAYPILFTGIAANINEVADRNLLEWLLPTNFYTDKTPTDAVGIYSGCYKLAIFISLAVQAFKYAAEPFFFRKAQDKNSPELFAKVMKYFVIACVFMFLVVSINLDILQFLLRKSSYREGLVVVPFLLMANVFLGIYYNLAIWFKITDKTYFGTFIGLTGASITLIMNILLIPIWGYFGSAIATLVCYFSMSLISYLFGQKYFPVPYDLKSAFFYILLGSGLVGISFYHQFENQWINYGFHFILIALFLGITFLKERKSIQL